MAMKEEIFRHIQCMQMKIDEEKEKRKNLKEMDLFVLDNSLRESTVGQLRGHTIEDKWEIYEQVHLSFSDLRTALLKLPEHHIVQEL